MRCRKNRGARSTASTPSLEAISSSDVGFHDPPAMAETSSLAFRACERGACGQVSRGLAVRVARVLRHLRRAGAATWQSANTQTATLAVGVRRRSMFSRTHSMCVLQILTEVCSSRDRGSSPLHEKHNQPVALSHRLLGANFAASKSGVEPLCTFFHADKIAKQVTLDLERSGGPFCSALFGAAVQVTPPRSCRANQRNFSQQPMQ
ncbi:hypothetical protein HRbin30_00897 [bacterium HR30]|nr:hypothetical protein HRbin30_00897 [bacterium HR30]